MKTSKMIGFLLSVTVLFTLVTSVVSMCTFDSSSSYFINETAPGSMCKVYFVRFLISLSFDTTIVNFTKEAGDTVSFSVIPSTLPLAAVTALQESLKFVEENTQVHLQTTKSLDLEVFWIDYRADIRLTNVTISCDGVQSSTTEITIVVTPVKEFPPVFLQGPYNLTLSESTSLMTTVFKLWDKVGDVDFGEQLNFVFSINPYLITDLDGIAFFDITCTKGDIVVTKALDFDNSAFRHVMTLNLSVTDRGGLKGFTFLEVKILDADDQPPYFDFPNCAKPCPVPSFMSITELDYKGPLQILPVPIKVLDNDTLGTKLLHLISSGNDQGMFTMDVNNGKVTQTKSVNEVGSPETEFRLVIKVRKNITIDLESIAILTVKVKERMSNDTGYQIATAKSTEKPGVYAITGESTETSVGYASAAKSTETTVGYAFTSKSTEIRGCFSSPVNSTETPGGYASPAKSNETPGVFTLPAKSTKTPAGYASSAKSNVTPGGYSSTAKSTKTPAGYASSAKSNETPGEYSSTAKSTKILAGFTSSDISTDTTGGFASTAKSTDTLDVLTSPAKSTKAPAGYASSAKSTEATGGNASTAKSTETQGGYASISKSTRSYASTAKSTETLGGYASTAKSSETTSSLLISTIVLGTLCGSTITALTVIIILYWKRRLVKKDTSDYVNRNIEQASVTLPTCSGVSDEHIYSSLVI